MDRRLLMKEVRCHCGSTATLQSNSVIYGREYGNGKAWICERYPECRSYVGTDPKGKPLGTLTDEETRRMRKKLHAIVDPLWKDRPDGSKSKNRGLVYGWLQRITGLPSRDCHIAMFDAEKCREVMELIRGNPYVPLDEWKESKPSSED
jgi:hypothetical protein